MMILVVLFAIAYSQPHFYLCMYVCVVNWQKLIDPPVISGAMASRLVLVLTLILTLQTLTSAQGWRLRRREENGDEEENPFKCPGVGSFPDGDVLLI